MIEYPVFLGGDTILLLAYPIESSIAEKLQAMVALGNANSRMKDFEDVWICSNHLDFNADTLRIPRHRERGFHVMVNTDSTAT